MAALPRIRPRDAKTIMQKINDTGFAFVQVMLMGVGDGTKASVYGAQPWIDNNPLTPNEAYFRNVDTFWISPARTI
jgi:uncharacterized protein DUF4038